ncbi:MAG: hypothetical protein WBO24_13350, partial [Nitrospirales bacterium]
KVFMIPSTALVFQEHGTQLAVVAEDDRVHFNPITVSKLLDSAVEVAEGVSITDRIVNNPSAALLEGDTVRIVTPAPGYDLLGKGGSLPPDAAPPTSAPAPPGGPMPTGAPAPKEAAASKEHSSP